ncbi:anti-sigma factor [Marinobacter caseinilyticus]|uniref:anti-sigma factor n=1 Tax=Marinobacter caseinilyticus TaxID=2692195 RepID=UPI00140D2210|nr:anti-sigma factor [Marinobacter caseinilyticus]
MKKTPERIESLSAEYVLGSLKGPARRRFERWMMESYRVRQEVWFWEEKLSGLSGVVPPQQPPASIWSAIEQRLWPESNVVQMPSRTSRPGWLWPSWGLVATAAALVMAVLLVQQPTAERFPMLSGAIVQQDSTDPLWLVSESGQENRLRLRPVGAAAAAPDKDYELWIVPEQGQPLSLGVIPVGDNTFQIELSDEVRAALDKSRTLAISLEPQGGSTTGAPTGPILHVTKLYEL